MFTAVATFFFVFKKKKKALQISVFFLYFLCPGNLKHTNWILYYRTVIAYYKFHCINIIFISPEKKVSSTTQVIYI